MNHHLLLLLALLLSLSSLAPTSSAATGSSSTLTQSGTLAGNQTLSSPGDAFRLGLFAASSRWFLGIWFAVSPDTVVWVANRHRPLTSPSGFLELTSHGALALRDGATNDTVWLSSNSSATNSGEVVAAELRDTGNLVVANTITGAVLWQSFEHPTDTFIPEMKVGKSLKTGAEWSLSSWRAADDPSPGDFTYVMDTSGSPELYILSHGGRKKTYRTGPWNGVRFSGIPEMTTFEDMFEFQFTSNSDEVSYLFRNRDGSPLSRVLLNESGVMQRMVWDKNSMSWSNFWSGPRDQCDAYAKCGAFGVCNVVDAVVCGCVTGFAPRSAAEWYMRNTSGGCARRTPLQCGGAGGGEDGFYVLKGVKLPDTHGAAVDAGATLEECGRRCLANCNCTAYAAADIRGGGSGCVQWFGDLVDTRFVDEGQDLYVRLAKSELDAPKNTRKFAVIIALVITGFVLLLLSLAFLLIWRKARRSKKVTMLDDAVELMSGECPTYSLGVIKTATNGFCADNEIGRGGFGIVYKGQLPDGQQVAVKKLSTANTVQGLNEFMNEVVLIAKLQHRNLVRLLGCCVHCSERMLVYEYMTNKSLDAFIFNNERQRASLRWKTRLEIILGIARGVLYLHQDSRLNIIHRDLKAANVLLDADMVAKISDFGIARPFKGNADRQETITKTIIGTYGYMAPEYAMDGTVSFMQDVYSFGVLLLEIVSGSKNHRGFNLIAHAWGLWEGGRSQDLVDPAIRGGCTAGELAQAATCVQVALLCVQECPSQRPPMADVIPMLSQQKAPAPPRRPVVCTPMQIHPGAAAAAALAVQAEITGGGNGELTITSLEGR